MDFLSKYPFATSKSVPEGADNRGTQLLLQAGFIRQEMAGVYHWLPMGLKVLRNVERVVREEMDALGAHEILMPALGAKERWITTGRWDKIDVLFKLDAATGKQYSLNPTHEELVTPLMLEFTRTYKSLPVAVYQIQNKFRNEARAKSGVLRGREFLMKDMYSFHASQDDLDAWFPKAEEAYRRVYARLGLADCTVYTLSDGEPYSKWGYEYQTILPIGEDDVHICAKCGLGHNSEIVKGPDFACVKCGAQEFRVEKCSEVGNIFKLGTRFSEACGLKVQTADGKSVVPVMGCYGIGVSRTLGVIAEKFADARGLVWPAGIAPYDVYVLVQGDNLEKAKKLAAQFEAEGKRALVDDRDLGFGQKAGDADLFGIPLRAAVTDKTLAAGGWERKLRTQAETTIVPWAA